MFLFVRADLNSIAAHDSITRNKPGETTNVLREFVRHRALSELRDKCVSIELWINKKVSESDASVDAGSFSRAVNTTVGLRHNFVNTPTILGQTTIQFFNKTPAAGTRCPRHEQVLVWFRASLA